MASYCFRGGTRFAIAGFLEAHHRNLAALNETLATLDRLVTGRREQLQALRSAGV